MSAKLNWFRLPVSHEVTVAVGADDVLDGVVEVVLGVELVLVCVVVVAAGAGAAPAASRVLISTGLVDRGSLLLCGRDAEAAWCGVLCGAVEA